MAEYETEEQQVEALKEWWKTNAIAVITGGILGIAALGGWRGWNWYQEEQAIKASDQYASVQAAIRDNDVETVLSQAEILRTKYTSTPYAALVTLLEAKLQAQQGDLSASAQSLRWVVEHSLQDSVQAIARIRLARVLVADNKLDEAAAIINQDMPDTYTSLINEIRGDIFLAKGETEQAMQAYDQALAPASASGVEYLQMKRNDLGS